MPPEWPELLVFVAVGFLSGAINAVAGGGSLLAFPALLASGMSPLVANVTNSVAQGPGFVGAAASQRADLKGSSRRLVRTSVAAAVGSVLGCVLLLMLPGSVFDTIVPALVGLSAILLAFQGTIRKWLGNPEQGGSDKTALLTVGIFLTSIYGGYFGGARSVVLIAVLALAVTDTLRRLNALKSWLGLIGSAMTFAVYALMAPVDWLAVVVLTPTTVFGGFLGGKVARWLHATLLRYIVVVISVGVAIYLAVD